MAQAIRLDTLGMERRSKLWISYSGSARISTGSQAGPVVQRPIGLDYIYTLLSAQLLSVVRDSRRTGAVAQLGERLICIQEVAGSIPTSSTNPSERSPQGWACSSVG